jgi:hypothetical protein
MATAHRLCAGHNARRGAGLHLRLLVRGCMRARYPYIASQSTNRQKRLRAEQQSNQHHGEDCAPHANSTLLRSTPISKAQADLRRTE